jgi:DNA-binding transcriptional MerR regulator
MPEVTDTGFLSIGEVLGQLLDEFPDITISKIRFLESQGLISPERTASGYRKFYNHDVELLKVILTEQRRNYLPLRVIKDRLDSGQIDRTGEHNRPDDDSTEAAPEEHAAPAKNGRGDRPAGNADDDSEMEAAATVPRASIRAHPASRRKSETVPEAGEQTSSPDEAASPTPEPESQLLPGVLLERHELCAMVGMTDDELTALETFAIVSPQPGDPALYTDDAVAIAKPACEFMRFGVDARHLRNWRTSAEREASLYEQLVTPRYRQRNPEARAEALTQLRRLDVLGAALRAAMTRQALRHHFES